MKPLSPEEFDKYVFEQHPEANFLQSAAWGRVYELTGNEVYYLGFFSGDNLSGACLAIKKDAKRGRYLEIPGGPLLDWGNAAAVGAAGLALRAVATREHCVFVRMRPNVPDTPENRAVAKAAGLVLAPFHLHAEHTVIVDLEKSLDEILAAMRRQTRYEVRRAEKLGLEVAVQTDEAAFAEFHGVQAQTAARQNFVPPSLKLILAEREAFGDRARLYVAKEGDKPLAYGLFIFHGREADYFEAASTEAGQRLPGAYALIWRAIGDAKAAGLKRLNLFGIAPPNSPNHRYAGVTTFKTGFGGELVNYLPAHDLIVAPMKYRLAKAVELTRKKRRHL